MKIVIASDHAGFSLKNIIANHLKDINIEFEDYGTFTEESCDYPEFAFKASEAVSRGEFDKGILVCGTGIGIGIAANKVKGIRAALCNDTFSAHATVEHNDSNILTLGSRVVGELLAIDIVDTFLKAKFQGGKHQKRIDMISNYEEEK